MFCFLNALGVVKDHGLKRKVIANTNPPYVQAFSKYVNTEVLDEAPLKQGWYKCLEWGGHLFLCQVAVLTETVTVTRLPLSRFWAVLKIRREECLLASDYGLF